ncbi:MAG: hypothetical protein NTV80_20175 [Verrucomicrobia bacterium]|nr:hypothetical protein [Verrucomicrobiota bacterium]
MNRVTLRFLTFILIVSAESLQADDLFKTQPFQSILVTQAIGGRYHFTQEAPLLESARMIAELGFGVMKFSISSKALLASQSPM